MTQFTGKNKKFFQINMEGTKIVNIYDSYKDLRHSMGLNKATNIHKLVHGKSKGHSAYGYLWNAKIMKKETEIKGISEQIILDEVQIECVKLMSKLIYEHLKTINNKGRAVRIKKFLIEFLNKADINLFN